MQAAGIERVGAPVEVIETGERRPLAGDEVLLEVRAAGVGNWDEFVRVGGWDVGAALLARKPRSVSRPGSAASRSTASTSVRTDASYATSRRYSETGSWRSLRRQLPPRGCRPGTRPGNRGSCGRGHRPDALTN